jgi:hypothetical protein
MALAFVDHTESHCTVRRLLANYPKERCGHVARARSLEAYTNALNGTLPSELTVLTKLQCVACLGDDS